MDKKQRDKKEIKIPERMENERRGTGSGLEKQPTVQFNAKAAAADKDPALCKVGKAYHLSYRMRCSSVKLVHDILTGHGFKEGEGRLFNLMWSGANIDPTVYRNLASFQRVNHFPNSMELGRKDSLCRNVKKLQKRDSRQSFDFMPESYVLPEEYVLFKESLRKNPGLFIKKPVASSQGHGIKIINLLSDVDRLDKAVISRYIQNPLLIDGYKFDLRLYVLVTSYNPLVIYLYEDGLARFATEKYDISGESTGDKFMHLTNTSVNMRSSKYVKSNDEEAEDCGSRWSLSAMLRFLKQSGRDTATLMSKIEDIVIKTIISAERPIAEACAQIVPNRNNCFELYGFDILIDTDMKPWLLEVNVSPSLSYCDPMDLKVKAHVVADALTLVGVQCQNGKTVVPIQTIDHQDVKIRKNPWQVESKKAIEERMKILQNFKDEEMRTRGFIRIFPTPDSWKTYGSLLVNQTTNYMLHQMAFIDAQSKDIGKHIEKYERQLPCLTRENIDVPVRNRDRDEPQSPPMQCTGQNQRTRPEDYIYRRPSRIIDDLYPQRMLRTEEKLNVAKKETIKVQAIPSSRKQVPLKREVLKAPTTTHTVKAVKEQKLPPLYKTTLVGLRQKQAPGTNKAQHVGLPVISDKRKNATHTTDVRAVQNKMRGKPVRILEKEPGKDLGRKTPVAPVHHSPETRVGSRGGQQPETLPFLHSRNEKLFKRVEKIFAGFSECHKQARAEAEKAELNKEYTPRRQ